MQEEGDRKGEKERVRRLGHHLLGVQEFQVDLWGQEDLVVPVVGWKRHTNVKNVPSSLPRPPKCVISLVALDTHRLSRQPTWPNLSIVSLEEVEMVKQSHLAVP